MKNYDNLYERLCSADNLKLAFRKARKGKTKKWYVIKFEENIDDELSQLHRELERQIAFKRYFLKSEKDIEDALHIEELFRDKLDYDKINKLKDAIINSERHEKRIHETR